MDSSDSCATLAIDGALLEGGGQVLRNAIALSTLLRRPVVVDHIRAGRSKPGLHAQHLTGLQLVATLCEAKLKGDHLGSGCVRFVPGNIKQGHYTADTGTAGSVGLLSQIALPCLVFAPGPCTVVLRGGTNADMAPQIDYLQNVFMSIARERLGLQVSYEIVRRGYFPRGQGEVIMRVTPTAFIPAFTLTDKGTVRAIHVWSFVAGVVPKHVAAQTAKAAKAVLKPHFNEALFVSIDIVQEPPQRAVGNASGILIWMETTTGCVLAGSALGARGTDAETVGRSAAEMLLENHQHGGCVDEYLQDQLIIFMALAEGRSQIISGPISLHTETAIYFAQQITSAKFQVTKYNDDPLDKRMLIACDGIGLRNQSLTSID